MAEVESDLMWGLLDPDLLMGEGGYYLTSYSGAVHVLKTFRSASVVPAHLPCVDDMHGRGRWKPAGTRHGSTMPTAGPPPLPPPRPLFGSRFPWDAAQASSKCTLPLRPTSAWCSRLSRSGRR